MMGNKPPHFTDCSEHFTAPPYLRCQLFNHINTIIPIKFTILSTSLRYFFCELIPNNLISVNHFTFFHRNSIANFISFAYYYYSLEFEKCIGRIINPSLFASHPSGKNKICKEARLFNKMNPRNFYKKLTTAIPSCH